MGTDKDADVFWAGNSWGASLARINTRTSEATTDQNMNFTDNWTCRGSPTP